MFWCGMVSPEPGVFFGSGLPRLSITVIYLSHVLRYSLLSVRGGIGFHRLSRRGRERDSLKRLYHDVIAWLFFRDKHAQPWHSLKADVFFNPGT